MVKIKRYTKQEAIKIVTKCAAAYNNELLNRCLLFITMDKHKRTGALEVHFLDRNYAHLTGLEIDKNTITGSRFFEMCTSGTLSPDDFEFRTDGTTHMKLDILPHLMTKNLLANMIGDYNGIGINLYTEKIAGGVKGCIGFRVDDITHVYVPNTVLNRDIRECTNEPLNRILATFRRRADEDHYSEIVYQAKKIDWSRVKFPDEYTYLYKSIK